MLQPTFSGFFYFRSMREDLLHYIWKNGKIPLVNLYTSSRKSLQIISLGIHNHDAGPDFFHAKLEIDGQLWVGNVEIHVKSSDWYAHQHNTDANYDNVILHVVWEEDTVVYRKNKEVIPALELINYIPGPLLTNYYKLFGSTKNNFINCETEVCLIDKFKFAFWLERLYFERLEEKSNEINRLLAEAKNNWEKVLFILLLKNFGLKLNGEAFLSLGRALEFEIVRKLTHNVFQLESILFGLSGLLDYASSKDKFLTQMRSEYSYLKNKFKINEKNIQSPSFFRLRPANFPTIRLSQLANLYAKRPQLFGKIITIKEVDQVYELFSISASKYWKTHYVFGKLSPKRENKLTRRFINLLLINTILPMIFCYSKWQGIDASAKIISIIHKLKKEDNKITRKFNNLGVNCSNAMNSQALLQLYNSYCTKNRCLECVVGDSLLKGI